MISLQELRAIAEAIGHRDWGYVKYILTIICLMLKSYQNISDNCEGDVLEGRGRDTASDMKGMINSLNDMALNKGQNSGGLYVPQNRGGQTALKEGERVSGSKAYSESEIKKQLASLETIFSKMKSINVQMNISNCWACQNNMCKLHHFPGSGYSNLPGLNGGRSFFNN